MAAMTKIADFDDPTFDPFVLDEANHGDHPDPYPALARLRRERGPVVELDYRVALGAPANRSLPKVKHFAVLGYDEVGLVLNDPATFSNGAYAFNLGISFGRSISTMDPPEHTRYRRIFQRAFLPTVVADWSETLVTPVVNSLIDAFVGRGRADLIHEFTKLYPFHIIYRQLHLPSADIHTFHRLAIAQTLSPTHPEYAKEAGRKLGDYFVDMVRERRRTPGDDLVSLLVQAEVEGEKLPEEIVISFLRQLINAAGDTTYRATSVMLTGLLRDPRQLEAVRRDRALVAAAIEEALRWEGPVLNQHRIATKDTMLGNVSIPAGSIVDALAGAANRDERKFADPDKYDIFRERKHRHYAFATGPHVCIGQHLARLEMTRALNALLDRLPGLRLDPERPGTEIRGVQLRVPRHIHVLFD